MAQVATLQQANFGVGYLFAVNAALANPTPVQFATLQDVQPDAGFEVKELYGQYTFPELIARGKGKLTLKAKVGRIYSGILNQLVLPGATTAAGITQLSANETATIPGTPFQITVLQGATFAQDLGVVYTSGTAAQIGKLLTRVASAPATGQYSVNTATGQYTFAAADTTLSVAISYSYTTATTGVTTSYTNQLLGNGSTVQLVCGNYFNNNFFGFKFYAALCDKLAFPMKNDDFTLNDLEFKLFTDSLGRVWDEYTLQ